MPLQSLQVHAFVPIFFLGYWVFDLGLHACMANTLLSHLLSSYHVFSTLASYTQM